MVSGSSATNRKLSMMFLISSIIPKICNYRFGRIFKAQGVQPSRYSGTANTLQHRKCSQGGNPEGYKFEKFLYLLTQLYDTYVKQLVKRKLFNIFI
jgi:hypothetical protein